MSATYTGDPSSRSIDAVRFMVGDTDLTDAALQDEEITWLLAQHGTAQGAAIAACRALQAKYARLADTQVDDVRESASQIAKGYAALLVSLQAQAATSSAALPYAGGISISGKQAREEDTDRVPPFFTREGGTVVSATVDEGEDD